MSPVDLTVVSLLRLPKNIRLIDLIDKRLCCQAIELYQGAKTFGKKSVGDSIPSVEVK